MMIKPNVLIALTIVLGIFLSSFQDSLNNVTIGNQIWMTKNLDVEKFRNGDPIPYANSAEEWQKASNSKSPAWCYYMGNENNGQVFGKLYNWHAVNDPRGLAPDGYHVANQEEWRELREYVSKQGYPGKLLKSKALWMENGAGIDKFQFSALPAGYRTYLGDFVGLGSIGYWYSSSDYSLAIAKANKMESNSIWITEANDPKSLGLSVRCIKD